MTNEQFDANLIAMIAAIAASGEPCPTNTEFGAITKTCEDRACRSIRRLRESGAIKTSTAPDNKGRVIEIVATGAKTAPSKVVVRAVNQSPAAGNGAALDRAAGFLNALRASGERFSDITKAEARRFVCRAEAGAMARAETIVHREAHYARADSGYRLHYGSP